MAIFIYVYIHTTVQKMKAIMLEKTFD